MRPASTFSDMQLSNSRKTTIFFFILHFLLFDLYSYCYTTFWSPWKPFSQLFYILLHLMAKNVTILSLTVRNLKSRCIPCVCWDVATFSVVTKFSNLFLPFAFLLNISHLALGDKLVIRPEATDLMEVIRDRFPFIERHKPLFLYSGKIHSLQCVQ